MAHFTFLFGFIPRYAASTHIPDWSIGLEMQFYLFFPFIAILLIRTHFVGGTFVLIALNLVSASIFWDWPYIGT